MREQGTGRHAKGFRHPTGHKEPAAGGELLDAGFRARLRVRDLHGFEAGLKSGLLIRIRMTGGFLGQVQRGRARGLRRVRCGRALAAVWVGFLLVAGTAGAQQGPSPSTPAQDPAQTPAGVPAQRPATSPPPSTSLPPALTPPPRVGAGTNADRSASARRSTGRNIR